MRELRSVARWRPAHVRRRKADAEAGASQRLPAT
eukprot:gene2460-19320_t